MNAPPEASLDEATHPVRRARRTGWRGGGRGRASMRDLGVGMPGSAGLGQL